jgi:phage major head subunit gpT-like protein
MLSGFANAAVKAEGSAVTFDTANEAFTSRYTHETVALAFAITEEAIEDNLYDRIATRYTKALARSMAQTKQIKAANVLNNGFNSSFPGGDGKELFATDHPTQSAGTLANELSTSADLSETSLEQAMIDIAAFKDERGFKIAARGLKLIIPSELQFTAERILRSPARVGTADNDLNALSSKGMLPQGYVVNNYLTDTDAFFIKTDVPNGMKMFNRANLKTAMEGDFDTGNVRYKARERYSFGFSDWRGMFGSPGA